MNESGQQAFEREIPAMLQEAYSYAGGADEVEFIWLYLSMQDQVIVAAPVYRIAGAVVGAADVDERLGQELDVSALRALWGELSDRTSELRKAFAEGGDVPTRIIVSYDVAQQRMDADFNYDSIEDPELEYNDVAEQWQRRLAETGDASA